MTASADHPAVPAVVRISKQIRKQIVEGEIRSGTPLRESALSHGLGVSRNTLRESLRLLVADGLATQVPFKGVVVNTIDQAKVSDIYVVRATLELRAVEQSGSASADAMAKMESAILLAEVASNEGRWREVSTASLQFHASLVGLLGSSLLNDFFDGVVAQLRLAFGQPSDHQPFQSGWIERDRKIFDLIVAGLRERAAARLRQYLDDSEQLVKSIVNKRGLEPDGGHLVREDLHHGETAPGAQPGVQG